MKDDLVKLIEEKSPQTTAELAKSLKLSWHRVQENLLELLIDGRVDRMVVGGRYLWFSKKDKKVYKKGYAGGLASTGMIAIVAMAVLVLAIVPASHFMLSTGLIENFSTFEDVSIESIIDTQPDACFGMNCPTSSIKCEDGYDATCQSACVDGKCPECTPDCSGHSLLPITGDVIDMNATETVDELLNQNSESNDILINETTPETNQSIINQTAAETIPVLNQTVFNQSIVNETFANETIFEDNLTVNKTFDSTSPTYSNFGINVTNPVVGEPVEFYASWYDESGLDSWVFSLNSFGIWKNETYYFGNQNWSRISKIFNMSGFVSYKFYASDIYKNFAETETRTIEVNEPVCEVNLTVKKEKVSLIINKTLKLGYLEISVLNISSDSYRTLELDQNYQRVEKTYYKVYIKIFNNFSRASGIYKLQDNEAVKISLEDSLGNTYNQDSEAQFFLRSHNLFGNSMEILPSSSREGYLIFSETKSIPETLTVRIKSGAKAEFRL